MKLLVKLSTFILLGQGFISPLTFADSITPPEGVSASMANDFVSVYARFNENRPPESWQEVADSGLFVLTPNSLLFVGRGVTETFSFILDNQRANLPEGNLILISYRPIMWPDAWKSGLVEMDMAALTDEQQQSMQTRFERAQERERPIRYLVFRAPDGRITSTWWYEDKVQAMLKETGITIPRPTPYYPKGPDGEYLPLTPQAIEALVRTGLTDTIPPELAAKMQAAGTLPAARPPRSPGATASDATSPPTPASTLALITSSPWTGWIVAAIVLLAAALYLRRQHAKRG